MLLADGAAYLSRTERAVPVGLLCVLRDMGKGGGIMATNVSRADRIRSYIDKTVKSCNPGTRLFTHELAAGLCNHLHHGESTHDVGMAMRERTDVRLVRSGVWEKI